MTLCDKTNEHKKEQDATFKTNHSVLDFEFVAIKLKHLNLHTGKVSNQAKEKVKNIIKPSIQNKLILFKLYLTTLIITIPGLTCPCSYRPLVGRVKKPVDAV